MSFTGNRAGSESRGGPEGEDASSEQEFSKSSAIPISGIVFLSV